jgi:hypothetical protein
MRLIYFDENKYRKDNPFFTICGILVPEAKGQRPKCFNWIARSPRSNPTSSAAFLWWPRMNSTGSGGFVVMNMRNETFEQEDDFQTALTAMRRAAERARQRARATTGVLVAWRDGRIVEEPVAQGLRDDSDQKA